MEGERQTADNVPDERAPLLRHAENPNDANGHRESQSCTSETDAEELSNARLTLVFGSIWIIVVLTALDSTILATLNALISSSFSSFNNLSWFGTAYLIATAATQPLAGRWTDLYGRRRGLLVAGLVFGIGTFLCGVATREWIFILGRVVAGAGGGATNAVSTFVGADLVPLRKRGVIQGINNIAMACGTALGGLVGGLISSWLNWKAAFLVQLPFIALGLVLCVTVRDIPSEPTRKSHQTLDYAGSVTLVSSIVLLLVGLNSGGNEVAWTHPLVYVTMILALLFFAIFIYIERHYAQHPIIPLHLMLRRTVWAGCLTYFFAHMAAFATMYYIPIYLQVRGYDPAHASLRFIPQSIGTAIGAYATGILIQYFGNYIWLSIVSHVFLVAAAALATTLDWQTPAWCPFLYLGMIGLGFGGMLVTTMLALISSVERADHAVITSASFAFRAIGSSVGITVSSAVFQNIFTHELYQKLGEGDEVNRLIEEVRRNLDAIWNLEPGIRGQVEDSYMKSFFFVFIAILAMSIASMVSSLAIQQNKLDGKLQRR
ncbi:major facilitator superfamily domain-containing protein [Xylaria cf. heliscus]|nr:major facilitator superfamily domain-containing protein [Xylaria cf. heliscus]